MIEGAANHRHASTIKPASNRQAVTTFGTTRRDNSTATFGTHAHQKAMSTFTANNGWLICTFHEKPLQIFLIIWTARHYTPFSIYCQELSANPQGNSRFFGQARQPARSCDKFLLWITLASKSKITPLVKPKTAGQSRKKNRAPSPNLLCDSSKKNRCRKGHFVPFATR